MARLGSVAKLVEPWRTRTAPALRRACVGAAGLALACGLSLARLGSTSSRVFAVIVFFAGALPFLFATLVFRRRSRDPRVALAATLVRTEPALGAAALRACALAERTALREDTGSSELAKLHFERLLGRARIGLLVGHAEAQAWRLTLLGVVLAVAGFGIVAPDPFKMVEALDVLFARHGQAPLPVAWLADWVVVATPPAYLGEPTELLEPARPAALPVGTVLTLRARPLHRGRAFVLGDGKRETPFQDDGQGGIVATWIVEDDAALRVGARFGAVLIREADRIELEAIVDRVPVVRVEHAPATFTLLDHPRIPLHWEASDDHALTEVQLVLRSGDREERRSLSKPKGPSDRGGIDLLATDKFIAKSYIPVEVTVEAKDDDPIRGPNWGRSASTVLIPLKIAEREVLRQVALTRARDAVTDLLATRVASDIEPNAAWIASQRKQQGVAFDTVNEVLKRDFGGLKFPGRVVSLVRGQLERVDKDLAALAKVQSQPAVDKLREDTENTLLGLDSVLDALGTQAARASALKLADVAVEASVSIKLGGEPLERPRADRRLAAALSVLRDGGRNVTELSELGFDLGEIIENDLERIERALKDGDRYHARLAADDLAVRLKQPDPSFASSGGGSMAGTESGGGGQDGGGSDASDESLALEQALNELRREHAFEMADVERALADALSDEEKQARREELRQLGNEVRKAVEALPENGAEPSSARSEAAQGRSQGDGMAAALERGDLGEAAESGKRAIEALKRAGKRAVDAPQGSSEREVANGARSAADALGGLVREAESQAAKARKKSSEAAKSSLEKSAPREKALAERARAIREKSSASDAPLPQEMLEKIDEAARQMDNAARDFAAHHGTSGLESQRQAQRLLEQAPGEKEEQEGEHSAQLGDEQKMAQDVDVPGERKDETADRFRRRVTEGLGRKSPGHLRDAVRRYTEGLLR